MGFLITKEFPSRFVSGDEVAGQEMALVIKDVKKELAHSPKTQKKEQVLVIYFEGGTRGVRLGKERAKEIKNALDSDDTDAWIGKKVIMFTLKKDAFGKERNIIHFKQA